MLLLGDARTRDTMGKDHITSILSLELVSYQTFQLLYILLKHFV